MVFIVIWWRHSDSNTIISNYNNNIYVSELNYAPVEHCNAGKHYSGNTIIIHSGEYADCVITSADAGDLLTVSGQCEV